MISANILSDTTENKKPLPHGKGKKLTTIV